MKRAIRKALWWFIIITILMMFLDYRTDLKDAGYNPSPVDGTLLPGAK